MWCGCVWEGEVLVVKWRGANSALNATANGHRLAPAELMALTTSKIHC